MWTFVCPIVHLFVSYDSWLSPLSFEGFVPSGTFYASTFSPVPLVFRGLVPSRTF
jgi:hypothetical protein